MNRLSDEQILVYAYLVTCLLTKEGVADCHWAKLPEQVELLHEVLQYRLGKGKFDPSQFPFIGVPNPNDLV